MIMSYGGLITNIVNYMTPTVRVVDLQILWSRVKEGGYFMFKTVKSFLYQYWTNAWTFLGEYKKANKFAGVKGRR